MGEHDCDAVLRELYTFLDQELTPDTKAAIEGHLNGCNDCLEVFDFEAEVRLLIAKRCVEPIPESLRQRVLEAIERADEAAADSSSDSPT